MPCLILFVCVCRAVKYAEQAKNENLYMHPPGFDFETFFPQARDLDLSATTTDLEYFFKVMHNRVIEIISRHGNTKLSYDYNLICF